MYYRMLGNTGLQVSIFSFGFWATFGAKSDLEHSKEGIEKAKEVLRVARAGGINLFDNAEVYGNPFGTAELIMGEAIRQLREEEPELWRRSDILVTTKIFWGGEGVNERGLSKKHIMEGLKKSLERLQVDYVDLVFCHRPDPLTPVATIVRAMTNVIRSDKACAWGTSEWTAQQITEAYWIAKTEGLEPPSMEQPEYNMFHRERFEKEYFPMYREPYNIGTTIWSPLASGFLTGKYLNGIPEGSRAKAKGYEWLIPRVEQWKKNGNMGKIESLMEYAKKELDCSIGQLALAWCAKNKNVTTVLLGATKPEQLEENLGALKVLEKLTNEHMEHISKVLDNNPDAWIATRVRQLNTI